MSVLVTYDWTPAVLREGSTQMGYLTTHQERDPATALAEMNCADFSSVFICGQINEDEV